MLNMLRLMSCQRQERQNIAIIDTEVFLLVQVSLCLGQSNDRVLDYRGTSTRSVRFSNSMSPNDESNAQFTVSKGKSALALLHGAPVQYTQSLAQKERVRGRDSRGSFGICGLGDFHWSAAAATVKGEWMRVGEESDGVSASSWTLTCA